nr:zinc-dependent metalloprotease family protein [Wenzhouxiangella sp. XN79A]
MESVCAHGIDSHRDEKASGTFGASPGSREPHAAAQASKSPGGTAVIDILLLYTGGAASNYDIEALANASITSMNVSFDDSDVDAVGRVVHYEASSYTAPLNVDPFQAITMAEQMKSTFPGNTFEDVTPLRNTHNADLALLIWDEARAGTTCGAGLPADSPSGNSETKWTANTGDGCISMFNNFTHEIGPNLGIGHDYPPNAGYQAYSFGNGYSYPGSGGVPEFRTIMGSNGSCTLSSCDRLNLWSDPGKTYQSQAIGVPSESDAVQALETMASVIGGYRTPSGAAPGAFGTVSIIRGLCFGDNWVNYAAPTGLVGWYEIETDSNSWFSSPDSFYRGVEESVPLEVTSSTWVRVRACNSAGCNAWKTGSQTATYTAGCL